ncbi:MAG: glycosyltransferase family 4 protein [Verrucomicrobia bacterium]|nr:glycosyltransferase family 4 protein [Verrucomicrobiota bacterium]
MHRNLAVFSDDLGASFIHLHLSNLHPGKTVALGNYGAAPLANLWPAECPALLFEQWKSRKSTRIARHLGFDLGKLRDREVEAFFKRHNIGVVLGEYLDQFLPFVPLMNRLRMPYVVQGHGYDVSEKLRDPEMVRKLSAYSSAQAILTRSEFHRQRLIQLGFSADKVHVNFGGVNVPSSIPLRDADSDRRMLAIGRMVSKKGPIYLLEAFRLACQKNPNLSLDYIGDGPLYPAAVEFVNACGLNAQVRLHGFASEELKKELVRKCGIFVQHSITNPETGDEEGLPAAIQEAMAHGMAVVSTRHAGIPEAVIEGKTGLLVDEGDSKAMAQAFLEVGAFAKQFGEAGYEEALKKHSWSHERDRLRHWLFESK